LLTTTARGPLRHYADADGDIGRGPREMSETPNEFFNERGFELRFTMHTHDELVAFYESANAKLSRDLQNHTRRAIADGRIGPVFADLHGRSSDLVMRAYGTGHDEESAGARAVERWKQEQGD
jgi:hypothetical protein